MKRLILTDSTADIPGNVARDLDIEVLPVNMILSMLDMIKKEIGDHPITLAIAHGRDLNIVLSLRSVFENTFDCREVFRTYFGPSIGINAGPDAIGVMYYTHEK